MSNGYPPVVQAPQRPAAPRYHRVPLHDTPEDIPGFAVVSDAAYAIWRIVAGLPHHQRIAACDAAKQWSYLEHSGRMAR